MKTLALLITLILAALTGCGGGSSGTEPGGTLTLKVTDAPMSGVENVWIKFDSIEIKPAGGPAITYDLAALKALDLLSLTDGTSAAILENVALPAGQYNWIRLYVNTIPGSVDPETVDFPNSPYSFITAGGENYPIDIPSSEQTGLKLVRPFAVAVGGSADFTIDFNLRRSVHIVPSWGYLMKPVIRIVDNTVVGKIEGKVTNIPQGYSCADGAVYIYSGMGVTPDDIDGIDPEPLLVVPTKISPLYDCCYRAAFLEPGQYTVAFTWDREQDDPATSETLIFPFAADATVTASQMTNVDIPLP